MNRSTCVAVGAALFAGIGVNAAHAGTAPTASTAATSAATTTSTTASEYMPLGTASFGPNGHGSYAWFVEVKTKQVVMCLVHNPQAPIECKRAPIPPG